MVYEKNFEGWGLAGAYMTKQEASKQAGRMNGVKEGYKDMYFHQEARQGKVYACMQIVMKESEEIARWVWKLQNQGLRMDDENSLWPG